MLIRDQGRITTIPEILRKFREADNAESIRRYEITIACIYASSLLNISAIVSFAARYFYESHNWPDYVADSLVLLLAGVTFSALPVLQSRRIPYILSPALTLVVFVFVTVRFHYLIGPAVWTFAFIQCILTMFWASRLKLCALGLAIAVSGIYVLFRYLSAEPYRIGFVYYITQAGLFSFLAVFALAFNRITIDWHGRFESEFKKAVRQKNELTALYEEKLASEKKLKAALDRLNLNREQMIQQEKLRGIGQLAAGIAHEVNNPLGSVSSNIETCRTYYGQLAEARKYLEERIHKMPAEVLKKNAEILGLIREINERSNLDFILSDLDEIHRDIEEGLSRISDIIQGIKSFSRSGQNSDFEEFDLNRGIRGALIMLKNEIRHAVRVVESLGDIPPIRAKANHIDQVLMNIILNAVQAIKAKFRDDQGTIVISTELRDDVVVCRIEDNGIGIREENLRQIFNPFFTTKPVGQGTGLGLSIAYDIIVNEHGGRLYCESKENAGARFTIELPVARQ